MLTYCSCSFEPPLPQAGPQQESSGFSGALGDLRPRMSLPESKVNTGASVQGRRPASLSQTSSYTRSWLELTCVPCI